MWQRKNESRINAVEMRSLRSMYGVSLSERIPNDVIRNRCELKDSIVTRVERGMLRWFGHLERMDERRLTKKIYCAKVDGSVGRGRPTKTFLSQIGQLLRKGQMRSTLNRRACMRGVMDVVEAKVVCRERSRWRSIVSAYPSGNKA